VAREVGRTLRELSERHLERRLRSPDLIARLRAEPTGLAVGPDRSATPSSTEAPDSQDPSLGLSAAGEPEPDVDELAGPDGAARDDGGSSVVGPVAAGSEASAR
jgi:hypothetical protein